MSFLCGAILVGLGWLLSSPEARIPLDPSGEAVEGWITTADGEPVPDARVALGPWTTISGADGWYHLSGPFPGRAVITISHPRHPRLVEPVVMAPGTVRHDWILPTGYRVRGWVWSQDGAPVAGASLTLELDPAEGARSYSEHSAGDGAFELPLVVAGRYRLTARAPGHAETELPETLLVDADIEGLEIVLVRGVTVTGRLNGLDDAELSLARARAVDESGAAREGRVDPSGRYEVADLRPGLWLVEAEVDEGRRHARARLELPADTPEVEQDLEFGGGLTLAGRVTYERAPLPEATVTLSGRELAVRRTVTTDAHGALRFADLDPGTYRLEVTKASERVVHSETLRVDADRFVVVELAGAKVSGRVLSTAEERGLADASVALRRLPGSRGAEELLVAAASDAEGYFVVPRVPPGRYRLAARRDGYAPVTRELEVHAGLDVTDLVLRLAPSRGLELVVRLASGHVPGSATAYVLDASERTVSEESRRLDPTGAARYTTVPPGSEWILVSAPGGAVTAARVEVARVEGARVEVPGGPTEVVLPDAGRLVIRVPGLALSDAVAEARLLDAGGRLLRALDLDGVLRESWPLVAGRAVVDGVPAGAWTVAVTAPDGQTWSGTVSTAGTGIAETSLE